MHRFTYKVLGFLLLLVLIFTSAAKIDAQNITPPDISDLILWYRADSNVVLNGTSVMQWNDNGGVNDSITQASATLQPLYVSNSGPLSNYKPAIRFDGSNDDLVGGPVQGLNDSSLTLFILTDNLGQTNSFPGTFMAGTNLTGFLMAKNASTRTYIINNKGAQIISPSNVIPDAGHPIRIYGVRKTLGVSTKTYINSDSVAVSTAAVATDTFQNGTLHIGKLNFSTGHTWNGNIYEIVAYRKALSNSEKASVEKYLYDKYAPPVDLGPDIAEAYSLCPVTLNASPRFTKYVWSTGDTTSAIIQVNRTGTYWVRATDVFGRQSTDTIQVTLPSAKLMQKDTTICSYNSITISPATNTGGYSYLWSTGSTTPSITTNMPGTYYVQITDTFNCSAGSDTIAVTVDSFIVSLGNDTSLCAGNTIALQNPSMGWGAFTFIWSPGGATTPTIPVNANGNYSVMVTNVNGCTATDDINVVIAGSAPIAGFSGDSLCLGNLYSPQSTSTSTDTSSIVLYHWDFGDGNTSTGEFATNFYQNYGTYQVTLTVTSSGGCSNSVTKPVVVNNIPTSSFTGALQGCINTPVVFTNTSTPVQNHAIISYQWNFGDGNNSTTASPSHLYSAVNTYTVELTVTDVVGCSASAQTNITIVSSAPAPDVASLITPSNNYSSPTNNITFSWSGSSAQYGLLISTDSTFATGLVYYTSATSYSTVLAGNARYFWKVRSYNVCKDSLETVPHAFTIFDPSNLSNLILWFSADTGVILSGSNVTKWNDHGGLVNDSVVQTSATSQPVYIPNSGPLTNYKPAVKFDGSNDDLAGGVVQGINDSSLTMFVLTDNLGQTNGYPGTFFIGSNLNGFLITKTTSTKAYTVNNNGGQSNSPPNLIPDAGHPYRVYGVKKTLRVSTKIYINGDSVGHATTTAGYDTFVNGNMHIGRMAFTGGSTWNGNILEILAYRKALTTDERKTVEKYLYDKYAPPVNLGPDIVSNYSLCPVTLNAGPRFVKYEWSNGDTVSNTIQVMITGVYWVKATDVFGRVSIDSINVKLPYSGINFTDTTICSHNSVTIQPIISASPYTYLWSNGATSQTITTTIPGTYTVYVSDTSACGITSAPVTVHIDSFSDISLLPTDTIMCSGNTLKITSGSYTLTNVVWSNGAQTPGTIINNAGNISVLATDINGCTAHDTSAIVIKGVAPLTDFAATNVCYGNASSFTDLSLAQLPDAISNWDWDFGDSTSSGNQNPTHIYNTFNSYAVTLTVLTDSGCSGTVTKNIEVYELPDASFTYPGVICAGSSSIFYDASTVPAGDNISAWQWTFNNSSVVTTANASYAFPTQGAINVQLVVTTDNGCVDSITKSIQAFPAVNGNFNFTGLCIGDTTRFTDITPSYSVISWQWNFGDNQPFSVKQNPIHKYQQPGNYNVTLQLVNAIGCVDYVTKNVKVVNKPVAKFGNLITCEDGFYTPLDSSIVLNDTISVWNWAIGGFNYTGPTPHRYFADTGTYNVKLSVTTISGCSDSTTHNISVKPRPHAEFGITPLYGSAPIDVTLLNQTTGATDYAWNFGDQNYSNLQNPTHTYTYNDSFNVVLTAYTTYGCQNTVSHKYYVSPTDLDLSVDEVEAGQTTLPDGTHLVKVIVHTSNLGTRIITNARFYISMGGVGLISEDWEGLLYSGQIMTDTFEAHFVTVPDKANSYICVLAKTVNNGETEINTINNQQCTDLAGTLQLVGPLPNPARNNATLGLILPKQGKVTIDIASVSGQYIVKGDELTLPEGRSDYTLPIGQMLAGEYFIRVWYNDNKVVTKFIVTK